MGIPHYFYILTQEYTDICNTSYNKECHHYYIDFNGMIHQSAALQIPCEQVKQATWDYLHTCIDLIKPAKTVAICADGVAPLAKMNQQRKRRFLSAIENKSAEWDKNAISPGTGFMNDFNIFMRGKIRDTPSKFVYNYSGTNEVGEGEHKIFKIIRSVPVDENIIIYGLDADLIMLSLISHHPNISLMREVVHAGLGDKVLDSDNAKFIYVNIDKLRCGILRNLVNKFNWNIDESVFDDIYSKSACEIIESYVVLCFLLGNDFLPHIPSLSLKKNGHSRLLYAAKGVNEKLQSYIIGGETDKESGHQPSPTINYEYLVEILKELSKDETEVMIKLNEEFLKKHPVSEKQYALHNKSPLIKEIYSNPGKWRSLYYKELFRANINNSSIIHDSCDLFIKGIEWTYNYYKQTPKDERWYYPYGYSPTILDLANYLQGNLHEYIPVKVSEDGVSAVQVPAPPTLKIANKLAASPISSDAQLLTILPPQSISILPEKLKVFMRDPKYGMAHLYPNEYEIQTYLKTYLWECIPVLPAIDIDLIEKCITLV